MILFVIKMAIVAFAISMFVAFVIHVLHSVITSKTISKYYDQKVREEFNRAKRIKKLRMKRIISDIKVIETMESNEIIDYYYGKNLKTQETEIVKNWKKEI